MKVYPACRSGLKISAYPPTLNNYDGDRHIIETIERTHLFKGHHYRLLRLMLPLL